MGPAPIIKVILLLLLLPNLAAASDYKIQVGDLIQVSLPGEPDLAQPFGVDRKGRIMLPEVGPVYVAGLTETELEQKIKVELGKVYRDLDTLRVYLYKKQLLIQVQGYVNNPGEFVLPASATIQMALQAAGGLRAGAQLDKFKLIRANTAQVFNYKQYLDSGEPSLLPTLKPLDRLFIPASPKTGNVEVAFDPAKLADAGDAPDERSAVKLFGEVKYPGSFAYRDEIGVVDLLMKAGGVTHYAGVEQIRIITQGEPVLFNLKQYLDTGDKALLPNIKPGATIFVPRQEAEIKTGGNMIYIMGEVAKPGAYEGKKGATFMDILANAGGPTRYAESRQIRILKTDGTIVPFDLSGYTEGTRAGGPPDIVPGDAIFVPEKTDINETSWLKVAPNRAVRVLGEVVRPGRVEWSDEMSLLDLLAHVGGPSARADTSNIEVVTPQPDGSSRIYTFDLDRFIKEGGRDDQLPPVRAGTTIRIHDLPQDPSDNKSQWVRQAPEKSIYIFGQVGAPGRYMFTNDMGFLDILGAADGPTAGADLRNIRINHRGEKFAKVSKVNLALYFETGDPHLLPQVKTGDTIYIPEKNRLWLDQPKEQTIRVLGAVNKPGRYRFDDSMTLLDLLAEAGGTSGSAYVEKITVVNLSTSRDQARTFDLKKFSRTADFNDLPVLRAGDTVYVPNKEDSALAKIRLAAQDIFTMAGLASLLGFL